MVRIDVSRTRYEKLKNLILLVIEKCNQYEDPHLGKTKLNKLLFFIDFLAYRELGQAVTGRDYQRLKNGPAPVCMLPVLTQMQNANYLHFKRESRFFRFSYEIPVADRKPDLTHFLEEEISLVDRIVTEHINETATQMSDRAYVEFGLREFEIGKRIPYGLALIGKGKLSQEDIDFAIQNGLVEKAAMWRESRSG